MSKIGPDETGPLLMGKLQSLQAGRACPRLSGQVRRMLWVVLQELI